jgi:hypothetical protein
VKIKKAELLNEAINIVVTKRRFQQWSRFFCEDSRDLIANKSHLKTLFARSELVLNLYCFNQIEGEPDSARRVILFDIDYT